ncbi:MAG: flagella basal body P-ring formation protein FlgA [Planctomycetes bacterium]|nr:flagella basal body P-ring formation protein FlgA [Planctomycetota bacterium]
MSPALCWMLGLSAVFWGPPGGAPISTDLRLRARVQVSGPTIRLGDVAAIGSSQDALSKLPLGASPAPAKTRIVTRTEVARLLRAQGIKLRLTGPRKVEVTRRYATLGGRQLVRMAERFVRRELELASTTKLVLRAASPARWHVPSQGRAGLRVRWLSRTPPTAGGPFDVEVEVRSAGETIAQLPLRFELQRPRSSPRPAALASSPAQPREARSSAGTVNTITRGQRVTVVVRSGALTVRAEGTAVKGGLLGESIPIRIRKGSPLVVGKVLASGQVLVELQPGGGR